MSEQKLTSAQQRLMRELPGWMILAMADVPDYWCKHLRNSQSGGTAHDEEWRAAHLWRCTYSWGFGISGSLARLERSNRADAVASITWTEITKWVESLPAELRAEARRNRKGDDDAVRAVVDQLLTHSAEAEQGALW